MTEDPDVSAEPAEDYEYDLAHDEATGRALTSPQTAPPQPPRPATAPDDDSGDYSYDAAHDFT